MAYFSADDRNLIVYDLVRRAEAGRMRLPRSDPAELVAECDASATIPVAAGAESLNVAMAGTIALYEASRGRSS